jgi:hypothetical protein
MQPAEKRIAVVTINKITSGSCDDIIIHVLIISLNSVVWRNMGSGTMEGNDSVEGNCFDRVAIHHCHHTPVCNRGIIAVTKETERVPLRRIFQILPECCALHRRILRILLECCTPHRRYFQYLLVFFPNKSKMLSDSSLVWALHPVRTDHWRGLCKYRRQSF